MFSTQHLDRMEQILAAVCADFECELVEYNGKADHVHLLVNFPPKVALSRLVNSLEGGVFTADAPGVPRAGPPLSAGATVVVGFLL